MKNFEINGQPLGTGSPTYFIADIAANHDGDLGRAKDLIWQAKEAGADAAKFQHFRAETIVSGEGFATLGSKVSHQAKWKKSVVEVYQNASVPWEWTQELVATCNEAGIAFFTSPYDLDMIDLIDPYVPAYKVGSGDITWLESIRKMAGKGKPVFLAAGASDLLDIQRAMAVLIDEFNAPALLMQCNTNYTVSQENFKYIRLKVLETFRAMYPNVPLGLSDHTPGHATVLGAVALGACAVEKHFTDNVNREGPDHAFAMDPLTWREMVARTRELEAALGDGNKQVERNERETLVIQRRSIRSAKALRKGHVLQRADLSVLRPAPEGSMPPYLIPNVVGRVLAIDLLAGTTIKEEHLR